jgi:hypothetical protein
MTNYINVVQTFPSTRIETGLRGLPVEVSLIAQLGHGSVKLGGTDFAKGDLTSLYSFVVGPAGHPFHRHAGHRIFTAISGSGGAQLRFATATDEAITANPSAFVESLHYINIPADCLFTVRFGGQTWHQFAPIYHNQRHPVFVALSCHTNELGGLVSEAIKQEVIANKASIPSLTEVLPTSVTSLLCAKNFDLASIPITTLSIDAPEGTLHKAMCNLVRGTSGLVRGAIAKLRSTKGYISKTGGASA